MEDKSPKGLIGGMMSNTKDILNEELAKVVTPIKSSHEISMPRPTVDEALEAPAAASDAPKLTALQELSQKIDLCLEKQKRLRFVTKEISEIIKKSV